MIIMGLGIFFLARSLFAGQTSSTANTNPSSGNIESGTQTKGKEPAKDSTMDMFSALTGGMDPRKMKFKLPDKVGNLLDEHEEKRRANIEAAGG